jgi:hypothetical protein
MNRYVKYSAVMNLLLLLFGCSRPLQESRVSVTQQPAKLQHDPGEEYTAWAICIDTSKSPLPDEFRKLKGIVQQSIESEITFNDLVWVIRIGDQFRPAALFQMPPKGRTRSERLQAIDRLRDAKQAVVQEIEGLQQVAGQTDLTTSIPVALNILLTQRATRKLLVIGSDFIQDDGRGRFTSAPPKLAEGLSASNVNVSLLITCPSPKYLGALAGCGKTTVRPKMLSRFHDWCG